MSSRTTIKTALIALALAAGLGACANTQYTAYPDENTPDHDGSGPFGRSVEYELRRAFYDSPPECVVVLPFLQDGRPVPESPLVEDALERQMAVKVERVIGRVKRERMVRDMAVDLGHPGDRRTFAINSRCRYGLQAQPWNTGTTYLVFWSQTRVGLDMQLVRLEDDQVLWRGRHVASRSDGGVPTSPFSAPVSMFHANNLVQDSDVEPSLVDDAARRILATMPDARYAMR